MAESSPLSEEQAYLDLLFEHVDLLRAQLSQRMVEIRKITADYDLPQALFERDHHIQSLHERLLNLNSAEQGLFFGRIDIDDPEETNPDNPISSEGENTPLLDRRYIGRFGITDQSSANMRTLLIDWRAPQARPFYLATALNTHGVHHRRHIRTRGRHVKAISDEKLSVHSANLPNSDSFVHAGSSQTQGSYESHGSVAQESALLHALSSARSRYMRDIVDTIVAEQDHIIRDEYRGVSVVHGGPGTGKTAVALHRAAYLLYTWRDILSKQGVLIIGPNSRFLNYISQVLPTLGETGVVLSTIGSLLPGIESLPATTDSVVAQEVKGSIEMITILKRAIALYQSIPEEPRELSIEGTSVLLSPRMVAQARQAARQSRRPHNEAQAIFISRLADIVTDKLFHSIGADPFGGDNFLSAADRVDLHDEVLNSADFQSSIEDYWPHLTPAIVLEDLFQSQDRIARVAADYDEFTQEALYRPYTSQESMWTETDIPLLDELRIMLGDISSEQSQKEKNQWDQDIHDAQKALDILSGSASQDTDDEFDSEILTAQDLLDAESLAQRQKYTHYLSTAERAAADPDWAYGHIIVDEAQELSPMAWRMVFRRTSNRWMTIVGDPAQTSNPAGVDSWEDTLSPFIDDRWVLHTLSVNYRTPKDIASLATNLLLRSGIELPHSEVHTIRDSGTGIRYIPSLDIAKDVIHSLPDVLSSYERGLCGIIYSPGYDTTTIHTQLQEFYNPDDHSYWYKGVEIIMTDTAAAKGLEFDEVFLLDPSLIMDHSPQGTQDLYVALTRATQGISIFYTEGSLPETLLPKTED